VEGLLLRPARTQDVATIRRLVDIYAPDRRLLSKATVTLYEDVTEFLVAELDGVVVACGAVHVMWEDLAEVRTVAVTLICAVAASAGCSSTRSSGGPATSASRRFSA